MPTESSLDLLSQDDRIGICAQPFLGWADGQPRMGSGEDSVGIVGPPRYGKTSGVIIPALLFWSGPAVVTSTRSDILRFAGNRRQALAAREGGRVYVYDPLHSEFASSLRWSPTADCADPSVCYRRVAAMTAVAGQGIRDADHWRNGAAQVLRAYFHAAALANLPLARVRRWLGTQTIAEPSSIIRAMSARAELWADDLESIARLGEQERGSFYQVARNALEATADPTVLDSCSGTDLNVLEFLTTCSTLFIIGPSHMQRAIAPLVTGLVDSIAQAAAVLAATTGGRLKRPLLLALDEVANIAPLESLPALVSEGGGRGILTLWATQSLAQLRARYGADLQSAILTATSAKLIYGGLSNGEDLRNVSTWAGEVREASSTFTRAGAGAQQGAGNAPVQVGSIYRPALPVERLQQLKPFRALLFYRDQPPVEVETRPAPTVSQFVWARGHGGWADVANGH